MEREIKQILCVEQVIVPRDRFTDGLRNVINWAVRVLAILMTFVIIMGVLDVVWVLVPETDAAAVHVASDQRYSGNFRRFYGGIDCHRDFH